MRALLRPASLFVLITYVLLSLVPCVPLLLGKPLEHPWQTLAIEVLAWLTVWGVFKRPAWFHWLLLPAFLALPTEVYLFTYFGQGISTHHLGIIAETSPREALDFLGEKIWLMGGVMLAVIAWWVLSWIAACRTRALDWQGRSRWIVLVLLALLACFWTYAYEFGVRGKPAAPAHAAASAAPAATAHAPALPASHVTVSQPAPASSASHAAASHAASTSAASGFGDPASSDDDEEDADEPASAGIPPAHDGAPKLPRLPYWAAVPFEFDAFSNSWPFGLMARGLDFYHERQYLAELGEKSRKFSFHAHQATPNTTPEVVVMVIGESSRYDRWSLNGYERDTNPLLKQEANLVTFPDIITAVSATRLSVPVMISRKPATQAMKDGFAEKSFITAYKEAGYKTYWLSNQISFGQFDTPVSVFANEADVVQFLNLGGFRGSSNFDEILFEPLQHALADPAPKKLIVLHTLGNHWNYSQRYPKSFDKWQPSLFGVDKPNYTDTRIKPQMSNSYDNSIRYTDWFLAQVIAKLKSSNEQTALMYVADHGQTLYDGSCNLAFHGHNTQFEFHIPAFVWYSDLYKDAYPDKIAQLLRHKKARLATENVFHTLLDLGDIRYPDERLEWSFVNPQFKQHKRYVDSYGWTNYDDAIIRGDCREVIDKHKPLKQDK